MTVIEPSDLCHYAESSSLFRISPISAAEFPKGKISFNLLSNILNLVDKI